MASPSKIEWTEHTWNPVVGCSIVSPGCTHCYAMAMAARIEAMKSSHYDGATKKVNGNAVWTGKITLAPDRILLEPLKRKKPTTYFVNSMGDLFHEDCPDEWIDKVIDVMARTPWHTYQVLTKRADRMRRFMSAVDVEKFVAFYAKRVVYAEGVPGWPARQPEWPPPNVWLGVSTERQTEADERIPHLLQTPAAVRFISAEPLLGALDLRKITAGVRNGVDALTGYRWAKGLPGPISSNLAASIPPYDLPDGLPGLDWVIVGGESGHGARPMHPDWARSLRDQCAAAGVAFFFKQWGEFHPSDAHDPETCPAAYRTPDAIHVSGKREFRPSERFALIGGRTPGWAGMCRVGKKAAGRLLDGIEHNDMPKVAA